MAPLTEHIVLRNRDIENLDDFEVYLKHGGYESLRVALK
jgi:NADH-quinone oxidoreductase subunit F